jgi:hypothetical protein
MALYPWDDDRDGPPLPSSGEADALHVEVTSDGSWVQVHAELQAGRSLSCQVTTDGNAVTAKVTRRVPQDELTSTLRFRPRARCTPNPEGVRS